MLIGSSECISNENFVISKMKNYNKIHDKNKVFIKNNESLKNSWRIKFRVNLNLHYPSLYINDAKLKCCTVYDFLICLDIIYYIYCILYSI